MYEADRNMYEADRNTRPDTAVRIAQVAPLIESVPPRLYGGTERVVAFLTDELVKLGHDVTLFASGDSDTLARLIPVGVVTIAALLILRGLSLGIPYLSPDLSAGSATCACHAR